MGKGVKIAGIILSCLALLATSGTAVYFGLTSNDGVDGTNGMSAYEIAVEYGYNGSELEWLASLAGENGKDGVNGQTAYELAVEKGYRGSEIEWLKSLIGSAGTDGQDGKSVYVLAIENGFEGTLSEWLDSLVGADGQDGRDGKDGIDGTNGKDGINGKDGVAGKSAYELAVENGFEGSLTEWLASLVGKDGSAADKGDKGDTGKSAYELAVEYGYKGTQQQWLNSLVGAQGPKGDKGDIGRSAYDIAVENGYTGTERQWINSLTGAQGEKGDKGDKGENGLDGVTPHIGENGNWWLGETDTGVRADAIGIENVSVDYKGHVVITLTDGSKHEIDITDTACEHDYLSVLISPTCTEKGFTKYTCTKCEHSYANDFVPESGHHFADGFCVFCDVEEPFGEISVDTAWYSSSATSYVIYTREQLAGLAYLVNKQSVTFSGKTVSLGNHIDLAYAEWIPIGSKDTPFAGTFNGKDLTISNLKITTLTSYVGLFGYVSGTVYNFKVDNANIRVESGAESYISIACAYSTTNISGIDVSGYIMAEKNKFVGGVVGYTTGLNVSKCSSSAEILGGTYVGGIAGAAEKMGTRIFSELSNSGKVTGAENYVGGLIGGIFNTGNMNKNYTTTISYCENTGDISGVDNVGGLFGYVYVSNTYSASYRIPINSTELHNTGDVCGAQYTGGIFGYCYSDNNTSTVKQSTSSANVLGSAYVGGIGGYMANIQIISCDNAGSTVAATGYIINDSVNYTYLGGYVGYGYSVSGCVNAVGINYEDIGYYVGGIIGYATGGLSFCDNTANIKGYDRVGGIAGQASAGGSVTYSNLTNSGNINGNKGSIGGLIGRIYESLNMNSAYSMTITECQNNGKIVGVNYVGGLFGYVYVSNTYSANYRIPINSTELHNTGDVCGAQYTGGIFGYCYSDNNTSTVKQSTSSANVLGSAYVGGIGGYMANIQVISCDNSGSTVAATGYIVNGSENYAYLGGYVGYGYTISDCRNNVEINYEDMGYYVGGIIGYATGGLSSCDNTANIKGYDRVGGIAGQASASVSVTYSNLTNSGNINGNKGSIGGLIGRIYESLNMNSAYSMTITECQNNGKIVGVNYVGGLFGYVNASNTYSASCRIPINSTELHNTGDVCGAQYTGGIFGYCYSDNNTSTLKQSTSSANVLGSAYVGGIGGYMANIQIISCDNAGSTIAATGYIVNGSENYAYLGGYVGYGYTISDCRNNVEINYEDIGYYVGGIIGYATGGLSSCDNTANIKGYHRVGGIAGQASASGSVTYDNLANDGKVMGNGSYVGGVIGRIYESLETNSKYSMTITNCENGGVVAGADYVGGLFGYVYVSNTYSANYRIPVNLTDLHNTGDVEGADYVAGLMGYFYADKASTLISYSSTGAVTATGNNTDVYIASSTNLTLSQS